MKREPTVYLIGVEGKEHPGAGRFPAFSRYLTAKFVPSPLRFRYMSSVWGSKVDHVVAVACRRPNYALGLLVQELAASVHMLFHRGSVYHSLKAEVDLHLLPRLSRLTRTSLVATFHDPPKALRHKQIGEQITRHLAGVVLLCQSQRKHFEKLLPPERIFCIPHGVDTEFFRPAEAPCDAPSVIAVGSSARDFTTLSRAVQLVWERCPAACLTLVGTRQADKWHPAPRLHDSRVRCLDGISDEELRRAYHEARLAVVSVVGATANNALLEAMACGLPVVATDIGGIREYVGEGAGVLCPPSDPGALADGIMQLLTDRAAAEWMGATGRQRALTFDYRIVADRHRDLYNRVRMLDDGHRG